MRSGLGWQPGSPLLEPSPRVTPAEISAPCCQEGPWFAPTAGQCALLHRHGPVGAQGCGSPWWPGVGDRPGRVGTTGVSLPGRRCCRQEKFLQSYLGGTKYESPLPFPNARRTVSFVYYGIIPQIPGNPRQMNGPARTRCVALGRWGSRHSWSAAAPGRAGKKTTRGLLGPVTARGCFWGRNERGPSKGMRVLHQNEGVVGLGGRGITLRDGHC